MGLLQLLTLQYSPQRYFMLVYVHGFCLSLPFIFLIRKIVSEGAFSRLTPISDFTYSSRYRVSVSYCIYIRVKSEGILTSTVFTSISTLTTVFNLVYQRGTVNVPTVVVLHFQVGLAVDSLFLIPNYYNHTTYSRYVFIAHIVDVLPLFW